MKLSSSLIIFIFVLLISVQLSAQDTEIDSLISVLKTEKKIKSKIPLLIQISNGYLQRRDYENFKKYADIGFELTVRKKDERNEMKFMMMFADYYYYKLEFEKSIKMLNSVLSISEKMNDKYYKGIAYQCYSKNYWRKGRYKRAVYFGTEAIMIFETLKDTINTVISKGNLGVVYLDIGNFEKAELIYEELEAYYSLANDFAALANTYEKIGVIKFFQGYYALARKYYNKAYHIYNDLGKKLEASIELGNIGETYEMEKKYEKAIEFYRKAVNTEKKYNYYSGMIFLYQAMGRSYHKLRNYSQAKRSYFISLDYINKIGESRELPNVYKLIYELYAEIGNYRKAFEYSLKALEMKDSITSTEVLNQINELTVKYETEKKEKENELLRKNQILKDEIIKGQKKKNQDQYIIILSILLLLIFITTGSVLLWRLYKRNMKTSSSLESKNVEINRLYFDITASIKYAGNIQSALLSSFIDVLPNFSEHFIFYEPSEVLSGDFYWSKMINDTIYFAAADSTGHGIPGALLSILGMSYLNEIVNTDYILPDTILNQLREKIKHTLNQQGKIGEQKDGWDISVCSLNIKTGDASYAGAFNSLYIISNEKKENPEMKHFTELKADRQPVSVYIKEKPFNNNTFKLKKGDILYFFTDGFSDQLSEIGEKKFTSRRFKQLLLSVSKETLDKQKSLINQTFKNWKGNFDQVDDVLVIGIKI